MDTITNQIKYKVWDEITYPSPNFKGCLVKFENGYVISSHILLGMWLLTYGGGTKGSPR